MGRMGHQGREGGKSPKRMQDLDNKELIWLSNQQVTRRLCGTLQHQCFKSQLPGISHSPTRTAGVSKRCGRLERRKVQYKSTSAVVAGGRG